MDATGIPLRAVKLPRVKQRRMASDRISSLPLIFCLSRSYDLRVLIFLASIVIIALREIKSTLPYSLNLLHWYFI